MMPASGDHHDRDVARPRILPKLHGQLVAAQHRHLIIRDKQIRRILGHQYQRFAAVVGNGPTLNGKSVSEPLPDLAFYNALLKIWLGDKPADTSLKPALLGEKS